MLKVVYKLLLGLVFCLSSITFAKPTVTVEALQAPAWIENGSSSTALKPGMKLQKNDRIKTGKAAKVVLRLSEGSHIKLGEQSLFVMNDISKQTSNGNQNSNVFTAALHILKGAFRFTTSKVGKFNKRNIDITLTTATIGIRGTDLWGRATPQQDFVCLLEGAITINRANEAEVRMDSPLSLYQANYQQVAEPVSTADPEAVAKLALETELEPFKGVISENGEYTVYLVSSTKQADALKAQARFAHLGYASDISTTNISGQTWNRVAIRNFVSIKDARYFAKQAEFTLHVNTAWVAKE